MTEHASMKKWKCPKCGDVREALAMMVVHGCPSDKDHTVKYEEVKDEGGDTSTD